MYLEQINQPSDLRTFNMEQLTALAEEMRSALLQRSSVHGGHFGPNFGIVEAAIALHYVFDSPKDQIVWDVSHQSYPHKMLTGRKLAYLDPEHYDDVSGFTEPEESEHDLFTIGHTSTSVSLACGLAKARDVKGEHRNVIAVIGDGSLSGGEALEGLNVAGELDSNLIIVVNDNEMSIAENHGGLYENLRQLRESNGQCRSNLFRAFGLDYCYVEQGNDVETLIGAFRQVKDSEKPVVVHIHTLKGKGYAPALENKEAWHYCGPFDIATGEALYHNEEEDYHTLTGAFLTEKMKADSTVVAITAGTPGVMGFDAEKRAEFAKQFVDVGIAEETAAAMASGVAAAGGKPVFGVYASFLQRAYDQLSQDICINHSAVTIPVFLGSVFGMNDVTHLGLQEIPMLSSIPELVYLAPATKEEYLAMLDWSLEQSIYPVAIKVPGGPVVSSGTPCTKDFSRLNTYEVTQRGKKAALIGAGAFYGLAEETARMIEEKTGTAPTVVNPMYLSGLDETLLEQLKADHDVVVTLEDGYVDGGFGEKIARFYGNSKVKVLNYGIRKAFYDRYDAMELLRENRMTPEQVTEDVLNLL